MIQLIVLLPLLAAAIAGLGNKALGKIPAKIVTTGALFAACAMSWPIFISFLTGHAEPYVAPVFTWIESGSFDELAARGGRFTDLLRAGGLMLEDKAPKAVEGSNVMPFPSKGAVG